MKEIEYWEARDKQAWDDGPWQREPDKAQWQDPLTGLPCLIVRGPVGALCGYVGVPPWHPWHGKKYSECTLPHGCPESWCSHAPETQLDVHGGLTFAHSCTQNGTEAWDKARLYFTRALKEQCEFPQGDAAEFVHTWKDVIGDFDAWKAKREGMTICHQVEAGETDCVWWFGFDCAHCDDLCPKLFGPLRTRLLDGVYRDLDYVKAECASLAQQLSAVAPPLPLCLPSA